MDVPAEDMVPGCPDDRVALRLVASIWARGASGLLHVSGGVSQDWILAFAGGGLVRAEDEPTLRAAMRARRARFVPSGADGTGHRTPVARCLGMAALRGAPTTWPEGRRAPTLTLLAPLPLLEEMGLYPDFRWQVRTEAGFAVPTGPVALAAQVYALEALGWARVGEPAAAPERPASLPPRGDTARGRLRSQPEVHLEEELLPFDLGHDGEEEDDGDALSLEGYVLQDEDDDDLRARVEEAEVFLRAGLWGEAERRLRALRDARLDNPLVVALLARARLGDVATVSHDALTEAVRWAALARGLSTGTPEVEDALAEFERARVQALAARAPCAPAAVSHRRAG